MRAHGERKGATRDEGKGAVERGAGAWGGRARGCVPSWNFKAIQYRRKGNAIANEDQLAPITSVPKREFMRRGINQHTLEKICRQEPARAIKFAKYLKALEEYESQHDPGEALD